LIAFFEERRESPVWQSRKITTFPIPHVQASNAQQFSLLLEDALKMK